MKRHIYSALAALPFAIVSLTPMLAMGGWMSSAELYGCLATQLLLTVGTFAAVYRAELAYHVEG